jgi:hypothetical protein
MFSIPDLGPNGWNIKASLDKVAAGGGEKVGIAMEQDQREPEWGCNVAGSDGEIIDSRGYSGLSRSCSSNLIRRTASESSEGGRGSGTQLPQALTPHEQEKNSDDTDLPMSLQIKSAVQAVISSRLRTACGGEGDQPSPYMM